MIFSITIAMKNNTLTLFLSTLVVVALLFGCGGKTPAPVSERIAKAWTAQKVDENVATVYTKGGTANVRNYDKFRLDLSKAPTVSFTDFDGNTFTGQYSVPSDTRLVLTGLTPSPTGTNGTIEFTISGLTDNGVTLAREGNSQKTGNTKNIYTLTNP